MVGDALHDLLVMLIAGAQRRVVVVTPYFVPVEVLQTVLWVAARRGIAVDLVLPARSNRRLADIAGTRVLRQLVEAGGSVWQLPYAMLHAKGIVIDDRYALAGSANRDLRSLFLNAEWMMLLHGRFDSEGVAGWIDGVLGRCELWQTRPSGVLRETLAGRVPLTAYQL